MANKAFQKANASKVGGQWWVSESVADLPVDNNKVQPTDLAIILNVSPIPGDRYDVYVFKVDSGVSYPYVNPRWELYIEGTGGGVGAPELFYAANLAAFPVTGDVAKMYIANDTKKIYQWDGAAYAILSPDNGTVSSVALTAPSIFTVSGSPVITTGTLDFSLDSQAEKLIFASPTVGAGVPAFRGLVLDDIPGVGDILNAQNVFTVGTGVGLFRDKVGQTLNFYSVLPEANSGMDVSLVGDDVVITKDIKTVFDSGKVYFEVVNPAGAPAGTYRVEATLI